MTNRKALYRKNARQGGRKVVLPDGVGARKRKRDHTRSSARHRRSFAGVRSR